MNHEQQQISGDLVQLIKQLADDAEFWKHEAKSAQEMQEIEYRENKALYAQKQKYLEKYLKYKKLYKAAKKIAENNIVYYNVLSPIVEDNTESPLHEE